MKIKSLLCAATATLLSAYAASAAVTADWTFETTPPTGATNSNIGPFAADSGAGSASGHHASATTVWSSPAGNGSAHSLSGNGWAVGDYYQFSFSTLGLNNILVNFDAVGSATGPRDFNFTYSLDGTNFTTLTNYTIVSGSSWSGTTAITNTTHLIDMSSATTVNNQATVYVRLTDASTVATNGGTVASTGTSRVDNFIVSGASGLPPSGVSLSTPNTTTNAGATVPFLAGVGAGDPPYVYFFKKGSTILSTVTNTAISNTFILSNVLGADSGNYTVLVSNGSGTSSSSIVAFTVQDPGISVQPVSQTALSNGVAEFSVVAGGSGLTYQWDYTDGSTTTGTVNNGTLASGAVVSGAQSSTLTISGVKPSDMTNYFVVVSGTGGGAPISSTNVSLTVGTTSVPLAYWDFNAPFDTNNPAPATGVGSATRVIADAFRSTVLDANDGGSPVGAWGTSDYPSSTAGNKTAGVQFNTSTAGAKNIIFTYDIRGTSTASEYYRLQYTTNGTTWIDYPTSSSLGANVGFQGPFTASFAGFQGVANNPSFGIRSVTEFESTAKYGDTNDANYVGVTSTYGTTSTYTYDVVTIDGDAIQAGYNPPVISPLANATLPDNTTTNITFTVSDASTPAGSIAISASALNTAASVSVSANNVGGTVTLTISSSLNNSFALYTPILITATDNNGDVTKAWFTLQINPANTPPSIVGLTNVYILANSSVSIPFVLTDDHDAASSLTPSALSGNSLLVSNDTSHLSFSGSGSNRVLTITLNSNQVGAVPISVSATDSGSKTGIVSFIVQSLPNTNVILVDSFDYDTVGSLISISGGLWSDLSGSNGQFSISTNGMAVISQLLSEDVDATLRGAPYSTNGTAQIYGSFIVNFSALPSSGGSYYANVLDSATIGTAQATAYGARLWASTLNAASNSFRLGIGNGSGATNGSGQFPVDLQLNTNIVVVFRFVPSTGLATIWVNPTSSNSMSVTATDTTLYPGIVDNPINVTSFAMRENSEEGVLTLDKLKVGLSYDSVFPSLKIVSSGSTATVTWPDVTLSIQSTTNLLQPFTTIPGATSPFSTNSTTPQFFKFAP